MQLFHSLLQRAGSLTVAPQQTSTMLLQLDGGILLLALLSLVGIAFRVSWPARCSTDVDNSKAESYEFLCDDRTHLMAVIC